MVDEWIAIERLKEQSIENTKRQEKDKTSNEQNQYQFNFNNNSEQLGELAKFKEIQKEQQLIEKYQDGATIQNKHKLYEEDLKKVKKEDITLKNHISESYESQIDQKRRKEIETKRYEREQEQKMINYAKEQLEEEKKRNLEKKIKFQEEVRRDYLEKMKNKESERDNQKIQLEEYNQMMKDNEKKEIERKNRYKQYYEFLGKKIGSREKIHADTVLTEERQKNKDYQDWVNKNQLDYLNKLKCQEDHIREQKISVINNLNYRIRKMQTIL